MHPLAHNESLAGVLLVDLRSVRVIVVDDLGEKIRGAVGAGQAPCPLFRVILPTNRLTRGDAEHHPLEIDDLWLTTLDLRL